MRWLSFALTLWLVVLTTVAPSPEGQTPKAVGSIVVDLASPGAAIPPTLYGIFFEEISHAGDGGLYAELIQNRGFEDANLPPACVLDPEGFIVPPRTPHFDTGKPNNWRLRWDVKSPHPAWTLDATGGSEARIALSIEQPLHERTPHSLEVDIAKIAPGGRVALLNEGYWGIGVTNGAEYRLTFHLRRAPGAGKGPIVPALEAADGTTVAAVAPGSPMSVSGQPDGWQKFEVTLRATATEPKARLALTFTSPGRMWLDMVSLFPSQTFKNRANGLRADLAQMVADLKPGFVRAPGGCFAEGITVESRPQWKLTLGPLESRRGTYSPWGYWSTDGFGYHEFLQFSEDIGADALYVVNVGVSCSFRSGTFLPDDDLPALIQDTLEAIEYAIGPPTSKWGAVRTAAGHPAPFPLKYVEIGNEQQGARYGERVAKFAQAIKAKYPGIKVALSSWISGIDRRAIDAAGPVDIVDEHAYKAVNWAIENFDSFAAYPRQGWDLYIGEFATNAGVGRGNWIAALNDAAYMMSVEKNTDLVKMASYAPLLENVNRRDWPVNMIHFDSSRLYGRATYYVNKLFAEHLPTMALKTTVDFTPAAPAPISGRVGVGTWNTSAEFRDLRVEQDGKIIYQSDFTSGARGWAPVTGRGQGSRGVWTVVEGAYRQSENVVGFSYLADVPADNVTITLKARKISGAEGFLVLAGTADGRRVQWNVAGWNNTQSAIQAGDAIIGQARRPHRIESDRWYDLKLEVRDRTVRGYLDGELINEATFPRVDKVLAIAGRDDRAGEIVIKAINTAAQPASMTIDLQNVRHFSKTGRLIRMSSPAPEDENSFEEPKKIVPVESPLAVPGPTFTHELPPYSLTILRVGARQQ